MALRLTGKTLQSAATAGQPSVNADSLVFQARTVLANGDVPAFSALFFSANEITDPQRCFHARLALIDAGLTVTAQATEGLATRVYVAIAEAALEMLEAEPAEPTILNLAGVALYELWSLDAAQALFRAARRLDPTLITAERNLDEVGRRRRGHRRTRPLHVAVPGLARRATSVAHRAKPASGLTLSLCMIVRDEEEMLPRCLAAVASAVDEIIVVDTGSTDATVEIAKSFDAKVIEFEWTGSFSEARNVSFEAATGDWVMYLDADEVLVAEDIEQLRALTSRTWREAFYLVETSYTGELGDGAAMVNNTLRVFRNRPEYRFRDRLHEQIAHTLPTYIPGRVEQTGVRVTHYGYLGSVRDAKEKSRRNVELLRKQAAESPRTPFLHFNLGSEYIVAGDLASAVDELKTSRSLLIADGTVTRVEFAPSLFSRLGMALRQAGRLAEADAAAQEGLELFPQFTDLVLAQARIAQMQGDDDRAVDLLSRCLEMGEAPARYGPQIGSGTFLARLALAELHLERDEVPEAREALQWCVDNHPDFLAVAGPYAAALLRDGVAPADVITALEGLDALPTTVRLTVAGILHTAGATAEAEHQYKVALDATPSNYRARTTLGELLLGRGAWDEAAEQGAAVPAGDPYAGLAVRIELCGLIGRADADRVATALHRADEAGLSKAEQSVFETWAAVAGGTEHTEPLAVAGAPLLGVIMEMLLRGRDGERFVALLPVLAQSRLVPREQRELLAQMYLKYGLLDRAAEEWIAVASETPDVRSMLGLAKVALAQDMPEDASNFATAALELDPASAEARTLLSRVPVASAA
jgi:tetratricopeptide (TPR) repeat protein